jgi:hypothetical protein
VFIRPIATAFDTIYSVPDAKRSSHIVHRQRLTHPIDAPSDRDYEHQKAPIFGAVTPGAMFGVPAPIAGLVG